MLKLAVIGKDVSQSQSPAMHTFLLHALGEECSYEAVSIPPEKFHERAEGLFETYDAFNVTIPFKTDIMPYLKELKGDAKTFGAVNVVLSKSRTGYNTDGMGFLLMLENAGVSVRGKDVLVLGAGGAGRSCIKKLAEAGANVFAYERDEKRLEAVAKEFGCFVPLSEVEARRYGVIFNCTGIGMHKTVGMTPSVRAKAGEQPVGEELLSLCDTAVDLIYVPKESEFLRIARTLGKKTVEGGPMLFYQAYYGDCIYVGREPKAEEAKRLYEEYLKAQAD